MLKLWVSVATLFLLILFLIATGYQTLSTKQKKVSTISSRPNSLQTPVTISSQSLFIPSWSMQNTNDFSGYNQLVYFGVTPDANGQLNDNGSSLDSVVTSSASAKKLLGIVMTDTDMNNSVLQNTSLQKKIIFQSSSLAKEKGFSGIVLDFEISALGFDSVIKSITAFETEFAKNAHANNLLFYSTIYGDDFVRARPFDAKALGSISDGIFVMAYDLHKANGDPGANFPLVDSSNYDFTTMVSDFLQNISPQKLTIIFGMYGYDWTVDNKGNSTGFATSLSLNKIHQTFFPACKLANCTVTRSQNAKETEIIYTDAKKAQHIVWFEDMNSVAAKEELLKIKGISNVAFWAYSYF